MEPVDEFFNDPSNTIEPESETESEPESEPEPEPEPEPELFEVKTPAKTKPRPRGRPKSRKEPSPQEIEVKALLKSKRLSELRRREAEQRRQTAELNAKKSGLFDKYLSGELSRDEILKNGFEPPKNIEVVKPRELTEKERRDQLLREFQF